MLTRVALTGIGLITPLGADVASNWEGLLSGQSGAKLIEDFDCVGLETRFAAQAHGFHPETYFSERDIYRLDRFMQFGIVAAAQAIADAGLPCVLGGEMAERAACYVGAGLPGLATMERTFASYTKKGARYGISPFALAGTLANLVGGRISIRHNIRGPVLSHVSACASGAHSIGEAARLIQWGHCDIAIAGGCEAPLTPVGIGAFNAMRALSCRNASPSTASRPFDRDRDGFVMGEGAGVVILEAFDKAVDRGARIYAEVTGYGASSDAYSVTLPPSDGRGAQRSMEEALRDARLSPEMVGYINAHGTSTRTNDIAESRAIKAAFSDHAYRLAVSSTKSMTGHLLGAAGGVETAYTALALHHQVLPPTINYTTPDPECDLDYVPNEARDARVNHALTNSFGFGGTNATLILSRAPA